MSYKITPALNKFQFNIYSQNGEDGVIEEILKRLVISNGNKNWCVEFGAWDGIHLSNTFALVEKNWNAVYIEGDSDRYQDLLKTSRKYSQIVPIQAFVTRFQNEENPLDRLLKQTQLPKEFELLSIDIDSYDLDVWESLTCYSPKIVIIEINSHVPPGIVWRHSPENQGNTFSATLNVAHHKGYTLVCHTGNCIFVRNDLVGKIKLDSQYIQYPELLFLYEFLHDSPWLPNKQFKLQRNPIIKFIPKFLRPIAKNLKSLMIGSKGQRR
jgi:hypothetical protein